MRQLSFTQLSSPVLVGRITQDIYRLHSHHATSNRLHRCCWHSSPAAHQRRPFPHPPNSAPPPAAAAGSRGAPGEDAAPVALINWEAVVVLAVVPPRQLARACTTASSRRRQRPSAVCSRCTSSTTSPTSRFLREFGKDMLIVGRFARAATQNPTPTGGGFAGDYAGDEFGERAPHWERNGNRVILRSISFAISAGHDARSTRPCRAPTTARSSPCSTSKPTAPIARLSSMSRAFSTTATRNRRDSRNDRRDALIHRARGRVS